MDEILRQCAPAMLNPSDSGEPAPGVVRGEQVEDPKSTAPIKDNAPINIAFTYSGLAALKMNATTLASFPDAFKQGMAARAERLHDTGPSAPDFWEGELGLPSVNGYFTGGFALSAENSTKESFWKAMRRDVRAFNDPVDEHGQTLRFGFRVLFRHFGLEILHIERAIGIATGLQRDLLAAAAVFINIPGVNTVSRWTGTEDLIFKIRKNLFETLTFVARKPA